MNKQRERRVMQGIMAVIVAVILFSIVVAPGKWFGSGEAAFGSILVLAGVGWCAWHWFARKKA